MEEIKNPNEKFRELNERIDNKQETIGVIGCGYIGMSLIEEFIGKCENIIGFDIDGYKINDLTRNNQGPYCDVEYTTDFLKIYECDVIFVCVPTPAPDGEVDNRPINNTFHAIKNYLKPGVLIIIESSVQIGYTEKFIDTLEGYNKIKCGYDFFMGYSPERVMPGNTEHNFENTPKIISAYDTCSYNLMLGLYQKACNVLIRADFIKEAEASKLIENSQRDVNIAFMNECTYKLTEKNINHKNVFDLCKTHWNFKEYSPGLVGGDCIPVSPHYLWALDYKNDDDTLLTLARYTNEMMPVWIAEQINKLIGSVVGKNILILGATYKDNVKSDKNSGIYKLAKELEDWSAHVFIWDSELNLGDSSKDGYDIVVIGTASKWVLDFVNSKDIHSFYKKNLPEDERILIDLPGMMNDYPLNYKYWRLR